MQQCVYVFAKNSDITISYNLGDLGGTYYSCSSKSSRKSTYVPRDYVYSYYSSGRMAAAIEGVMGAESGSDIIAGAVAGFLSTYIYDWNLKNLLSKNTSFINFSRLTILGCIGEEEMYAVNSLNVYQRYVGKFYYGEYNEY